jgi:hypothetical protein
MFQFSRKRFSYPFIILIIFILVGAILFYKYWSLPKGEGEGKLTEQKIRELKKEELTKRLEEAKKAGNELNIPKPVGDWILTVTNIRRIPNAQALPYLIHKTTYKDVVIIDLLFTAGPDCLECYVSTLINDYKLQTLDGIVMERGEYSTSFESAPFTDRKYSGNQAFLAGEKGEHQAYFFADPENNDFIFNYYDFSSKETQFYRLEL